MNARAAIFLGIAIAIASPRIAHAQQKQHPPLSQALTGDARALYESGRDLFRNSEWAAALAKFQRASELSSDPRLLWNMAACERKLKHNAQVLRLIDAYLAAGEGWLSEDERAEARRAALAVRPFVAAVTVTSEPSGAEVFVDDVRIGTTPLASAYLVDMGTRRVRFTKSGYRDVTRTEEISGGTELTWAASLAPEQEATASPPPSNVGIAVVPEPPKPVRPAPTRIGPIILAGAGVAIAGTGAVLVGVTANEFSTERASCGTSCPPSRWDRYQTEQRVGDVLLGVGALALVGAATWWLLVPRGDEKRSAFIVPTASGIGARF
jgi:hypothetical protein